MNIEDATNATQELSLLERSVFSYEMLSRSVLLKENHEVFSSRQDLFESGILVEPFWEDINDLEGQCYLRYIDGNPDFDLTVRKGVLDRLKFVSASLPNDLSLVIKAGFRPLSVQKAVLEVFMDCSRLSHPGWTEQKHLTHARTFVADPDVVCPSHVTGGAVDVTLRHKLTGENIDMGCDLNTDSEVSFLHYPNLSASQKNNRQLLLKLMLDAGFAPNVYEWWHFQYGETYWAAFYGHNQSVYGLVNS